MQNFLCLALLGHTAREMGEYRHWHPLGGEYSEELVCDLRCQMDKGNLTAERTAIVCDSHPVRDSDTPLVTQHLPSTSQSLNPEAHHQAVCSPAPP